jgi:hypothetical protein
LKNFFLLLLLANALVLCWQYWILPPEVNAYALRGVSREREIPIFSRSAPRPPKAPPQSAGVEQPQIRPEATASAALRCARVGPFAEAAVAGTARDAILRNGGQVTESSDEGQIWMGHGVQLENVGDRSRAEKVLATLIAGGVPEAFLAQPGPPFSISLGVFREVDRAEKVVAIAKSLGLSPLVTDRFRTGTEYWLTASLPAGQTIELSRLGLDPGQIVRVELVPCVAPREAIN